MKRFLMVVVLVLLVVSSSCAEDIDLSGLTFDQLVQLQTRINMELMQRDEWQEVTVPEGVYLVGRDIPAGTWNIRSSNPERDLSIYLGKNLTESKNSVEIDDTFESHDADDGATYVADLQEGWYIEIKFRPAIFTPFTGHSLGFK